MKYLDYLSEIESQDEIELFDDEPVNEYDVSIVNKGNTYMGYASANKDKQNANKENQSANKGKLSTIEDTIRAFKRWGVRIGLWKQNERTTCNWLPDKIYPVESFSSDKKKQVEVNIDSGDKSEQKTKNCSSDSIESSDDYKPFDPSDSLKKSINLLA